MKIVVFVKFFIGERYFKGANRSLKIDYQLGFILFIYCEHLQFMIVIAADYGATI